jgi:MerR family transcriptional regulator, copper efflux regulator
MADALLPQKLCEYLTVSEAAQLLGVSAWTLRNWDRTGKLKSHRHPVNRYRLYRREDLEALLLRVRTTT